VKRKRQGGKKGNGGQTLESTAHGRHSSSSWLIGWWIRRRARRAARSRTAARPGALRARGRERPQSLRMSCCVAGGAVGAVALGISASVTTDGERTAAHRCSTAARSIPAGMRCGSPCALEQQPSRGAWRAAPRQPPLFAGAPQQGSGECDLAQAAHGAATGRSNAQTRTAPIPRIRRMQGSVYAAAPKHPLVPMRGARRTSSVASR
jgi:hypothetical protein